MLTRKLWVAFALWEAVALVVAFLVPHTQPGGGFDQGIFWGVFVGVTIVWWAVFFMATGLIDYTKGR